MDTTCDLEQALYACTNLSAHCQRIQLNLRAFLVFSNIAFLFIPLTVVILRRSNRQSFIPTDAWLCVIFVSLSAMGTFYHKCDTDHAIGLVCGAWCVRDIELLRAADETFAGLAFHSIMLFDWWPSSPFHNQWAVAYILASTMTIPIFGILLQTFDYHYMYFLLSVALCDVGVRVILPDEYKLDRKCACMTAKWSERNQGIWDLFDWLQSWFPLSSVWAWILLTPISIGFSLTAFMIQYRDAVHGSYGQDHTLWHFFTFAAAVAMMLALFKRRTPGIYLPNPMPANAREVSRLFSPYTTGKFPR